MAQIDIVESKEFVKERSRPKKIPTGQYLHKVKPLMYQSVSVHPFIHPSTYSMNLVCIHNGLGNVLSSGEQKWFLSPKFRIW